MNELDFTFEPSPWELAAEALRPGEHLSALRLLSLLEGEDQEALEQVFQVLEEKGIVPDVSTLPPDPGVGDTALRLRQEAQLARKGKLPEGLEENDPLRLYLEELAEIPPVADPEALAVRGANGDRQAIEALAGGLLPRVAALAMEYTGRGVLLLDLIQEGSLGLWQGLLHYPGGGLAAHTERWVRTYLAKCVIQQARSSGLGERLRKSVQAYQAADKRLLASLGRNPTLEEIAAALNMTPEDAAVIEKQLRDARLAARAQRAPAPAEAEQTVENTAYFQSRQRIAELLSGLSGAEEQLLRLRFGLDDGVPLSPQETGRRLGLTPEEVTARETAALKKLRN